MVYILAYFASDEKNTKVQPFKLKLSDFLFVKKVLKFMLKNDNHQVQK